MIKQALLVYASTALVAVSAMDAKISLYKPATSAKTGSVSYLDCGNTFASIPISLPIDTCLWGDYFLVNNFKITQYPTCGSGAPATALFYEGTSCTGKPTFTSERSGNRSAAEITDRCLFGSSPKQWSVVFRCGNSETQSVQPGRFTQAIPPTYQWSQRNRPVPAGGVITPYYSIDCTIYRPKAPTFIDSNVCLTLEPGHSIYISQPAVCKDNKIAQAVAFLDEGCTDRTGVLGSDVFSDRYYDSIDKKCHTTLARSFAFTCRDASYPLPGFADVPPHEHRDVAPLILLDRPTAPAPTPTSTKLAPAPAPTSPPSDPGMPKPGGQDARLVGYRETKCKMEPGRMGTIATVKVDTCHSTADFGSFRITTAAFCEDGIRAPLELYRGPGCLRETLGAVDKYAQGCVSSEGFDSILFRCARTDGPGGDKDKGNEGGGGGGGGAGAVATVFFVISLIILSLVAITIIIFMVRGPVVLKQAGKLFQQLKSRFGRDEGLIQL
ncbi:hypothetical protein BX600DRAFT_474005 [Xylariales sp. PMI_506]|nr:hypothetical protein BX600DRAFT_474005 [Xylariales sp. PMI_506]